MRISTTGLWYLGASLIATALAGTAQITWVAFPAVLGIATVAHALAKGIEEVDGR